MPLPRGLRLSAGGRQPSRFTRTNHPPPPTPAIAFQDPSPLASVFAGASRIERGAVQSLRWRREPPSLHYGQTVARDIVSAICYLVRHQCHIGLVNHKVSPCAGTAYTLVLWYHYSCDLFSNLPAASRITIPLPPSTKRTMVKMETMDRGSIYEHDIPSLTASLEAFDPERSVHSTYSARSNLQSSSRWSAQEAEESEAESEGPWAPPAWQRSNNNWYRKSVLSESAMRSSPSKSPGHASAYDFRSDRDVTPSRIPLPESPLKGTPRTSPEPVSEQEMRGFSPENIASRMQSPSEEPQAGAGAQEDDLAISQHEDGSGNLDGCTYTFSSSVNISRRSLSVHAWTFTRQLGLTRP